MKKILLIGSYGRGNLGDDAFIYSAIKLFPNCEIYINSANDDLLPADIRAQVKTIHTTGLRDLFVKIRTMFSVSHIVYCGGDLWVELYGDTFPRISLYKMAVLNFCLRIIGKKIAYFGCGAGNIRGYSLLLARFSARLADTIITREQHTKNLLGLEKISVLPDLTINLFDNTTRKHVPTKEIGISVMYYIPQPEINYEKYLTSVISLIKELKDTYDFRIKLIPMLISDDKHDDLSVCKEIMDRFGASNSDELSIIEYSSVHDFLGQLAKFDFVISTTLHTNILAILSGVPAVGISYRPKVSNFFKDINLSDKAVEIDKISAIPNIINEIMSNYEQYESIVNKVKLALISNKEEYESIATNFIKK